MHLVLLCVLKWKWIATFHLISTIVEHAGLCGKQKPINKQTKEEKRNFLYCSIASLFCVKAKTIEWCLIFLKEKKSSCNNKTITRWNSIYRIGWKKKQKQNNRNWKVKTRKRCTYTFTANCLLHYGCGCERISSKKCFFFIQFNSVWKTLAFCVTLQTVAHNLDKHYRITMCNTRHDSSLYFFPSS